MPSLRSELRSELENVVKKARVIAERGATAAIEALTVHEAKSGNHLDATGRESRARLRAHAKQLGDPRKPNGEQAMSRLIRECAYEHWHRMLFARFLAENDLLIHPEHNVSVSLDDVQELAREQEVDPWELASRFAQRMLPQIFRPDDPVLAVALPREQTLDLEQLLESLPADVFKADDSLGWVYQFWQAEEKDRVNASGEKITGETLPAVTQLFTEHYMVLFLLHNTIGAWWAGKRFADPVTKRRVDAANTEAEVRAIFNLPDYGFEYLRFVREPREGDEDGKPTGSWRPAAGSFDGWPREVKDLKVLDPCCGSGHFLVAAFELLVGLRVVEDGCSLEEAIRGVLAENLFGLELDARCTQIAAFNLALAAWRIAGKPIDLPRLNIACSGLGPHASEDEWLRLAEQSGVPIPALGHEAIKNGLLNLHALFSKAPTLGSLIDPSQLPADLIAADYETLQPYLSAALSGEHADDDTHERTVAASGMVKAAELLGRDYTLVMTNVPYLARRFQGDVLADYLERHFNDGAGDLACACVDRLTGLTSSVGCIALVSPQNWLFQKTYEGFRTRLLTRDDWLAVVLLGAGAFTEISGEVVKAQLQIASVRATTRRKVYVCDVSSAPTPQAKAVAIKTDHFVAVDQDGAVRTPGARITADQGVGSSLLQDVANSFQGMSTADNPRFRFNFWECGVLPRGWKLQVSSTAPTKPFGGREFIVDFETLRRYGKAYGAALRGQDAWGKCGVAIRQTAPLYASLYNGECFDISVHVLVPKNQVHLAPVWNYCSSDVYYPDVARLDRKRNVTTATIAQVTFDPEQWRDPPLPAEISDDGVLLYPPTDDPTQWLFHGFPKESTSPVQVALIRLLGYRWPAEFDESMRLSDQARKLVERCNEFLPMADADGIACIPAVRGERSVADRLAILLEECDVKPNRDLDVWVRDGFFDEHCDLFHDLPFIWHIWDGRKDGFHALVNYHKLAAPGDAGRRLLTALTHSHLGDWIKDQKDQVNEGKPGAEARLTAALELKAELEKILAGEPPYDIFVRWKPLREQPIGWEPDINDGVRLNIRPFLMAKDVGRKGAGVLRCKPNIKWDKDRGKEPQSLRPKAEFPWFWGCGPEKHPAHRTNFAGGETFDGNRWNDLHFTNTFKQAARERQTQAVAS